MTQKLIKIICALLLIPQTLGLLSKQNWFFELFIHYIAYYTIAAILLFPFALKLKLWKTATILITIIALNLPHLIPYYQTQAQTPAAGDEIKVFSSNFFYLNEDFETIKGVVEEENPDIVAILEANVPWISQKDEYKETYPYMHITDKFGPFGIVLMSKFPAEFRQINWRQEPAVEAIIDGKYRVLAIHAQAPVKKSWAGDRNYYFEQLTEEINRSELPTIVMGDFNSAAWSPYFKKILEGTSLKEARKGYGLVATWNASKPIFWIPIDHILVSPEIEVLDFYRGSNTNSDHYPVVASLKLP